MFRLLTLHNFLPLSEKTQSNSVQKNLYSHNASHVSSKPFYVFLKMCELFKEESNCFLKQCYTTPSLHWRSTADKKTCSLPLGMTNIMLHIISTNFGFPKNVL